MTGLVALTMFLLGISGLPVVFAQPPQGSLTLRQIVEAAMPSVVVVTMRNAAGKQISLGSGFFIRSDVLVTNAHVIRGATSGTVNMVGDPRQYGILGIVEIDRANDLALLKVSGTTAPPLSLADFKSVGVGDAVAVIGNPQGLEGTLSTGIVSGIRRNRASIVAQITAPISPGSSGGPVLNDRGEVIGVAFLSLIGGQSLNFAIPVSYVQALATSGGEQIAPLSTSPTATSRAAAPTQPPRRPPPVQPPAVAVQPPRDARPHHDYLTETVEMYKAGLERMIPTYEADLQRRTVLRDQAVDMYSRREISFSEVERANRLVMAARERLAQTRRDIADADRLIQESRERWDKVQSVGRRDRSGRP